MMAVKSGCLYILYIEHGPCSHGHKLSLSATFVLGQFFFMCVHTFVCTILPRQLKPSSRLNPRSGTTTHPEFFYHLPPPSVKTHHDEKGSENERAGREKEGSNVHLE